MGLTCYMMHQGQEQQYICLVLRGPYAPVNITTHVKKQMVNISFTAPRPTPSALQDGHLQKTQSVVMASLQSLSGSGHLRMPPVNKPDTARSLFLSVSRHQARKAVHGSDVCCQPHAVHNRRSPSALYGNGLSVVQCGECRCIAQTKC